MNKEDLKFVNGRLHFQESADISAEIQEKKIKPSKEAEELIALHVQIEAIHAGKTKNNTFYSSEKLRGDALMSSGVHSWIYPYNKPMLTHHNQYNGEPVGRVIEAQYVTTTKANREGIIVKAEVVDKDAMTKVLDGRYKTVSIGAETDAAVCSVCGKDVIKDGYCGHWPGEVYDGEKCFFMVGNLWFSELSFVNVPADQDAMVVSVTRIKDTQESFDYGIYKEIQKMREQGMTEKDIAENWNKKNKEKTSTLEKLLEAHDVLHTLWNESEYNWDRDKIKEWHDKVSQQLIDDYKHDHISLDNLDA
jgi:hypothetical protein